MTKKMINVAVGADVEVVDSRAPGLGGNRRYLKYGYRESLYFEGCGIDGIIKSLQRIKKKYKKEYTDMSIDSIRDCGCYHDCTCSPTLYVAGNRLENDVEYEHRIADEQRRKAEQGQRDRKEFERLKERLGEK